MWKKRALRHVRISHEVTVRGQGLIAGNEAVVRLDLYTLREIKFRDASVQLMKYSSSIDSKETKQPR